VDTHFPTFRRLTELRRSPLLYWGAPYSTDLQRLALLRILAVAIEENLPLVPLLSNWAKDERGRQRQRVLRLVKLLKTGMALPDAVESVPGVLSEEGALALRFDAQSGTRADAARRLIEESSPGSGEHAGRARRPLAYFVVVLCATCLAIAFMQIKILPVIYAIYSDFEIDVPRIVDQTVEVSRHFIKYWYFYVALVLAIAWLFLSTRGGRFFRRSLLGRFFSPYRVVRAAGVLQNLASTIKAGRPIPGALSTLARYHFDPNVRRKLLFVRNEVEQGAEVWQSMANVGLLSPAEARVMLTAERVGNRASALSQIARAKRRQTRRRLDRWWQALTPAAVVVLGLIVLVHALTVFVPLRQLILTVEQY
jgi:type II secretory pathway component PulF